MGIYRKGFKEMFARNKWRIMRGDRVQIVAGKDKGQTGTVLKVIRDHQFPRVVIEGLNLNKRVIKRTQDNPGGPVSVEGPLHYSNVSLIDPVSSLPVRTTWRYLESGAKVRVTSGKGASGSVVPRPDVLKLRRKPRNIEAGAADTVTKDVQEVTHKPGDLPSFLKRQLAAVDKAAAGAAAGAGGQQQRQYSSMAAAGAAASGGGGVLGIATRLLGGTGRLASLRGGGMWRGFAAGAFW